VCVCVCVSDVPSSIVSHRNQNVVDGLGWSDLAQGQDACEPTYATHVYAHTHTYAHIHREKMFTSMEAQPIA
jgi:hypothetical protein